MTGEVTSIFEKLGQRPEPTLLPVPEEVRGFRVRLDLEGATPPVWRRLDLPGDLILPRVHDVIQAAMGWQDCHLHRFTTSSDPRAPYLLTQFDVDEGEEGVVEDVVRLDQVVAAKGDRLWYEYDFGDSWYHVLEVEAVLDAPPPVPHCLTGRMACPPEDCGGLGGYEDLAEWVRSGYDEARLPEGFDSAEHAHGWLPDGWDPDRFDVEAVNAALESVVAEPVQVTGELATLAEYAERRGDRVLRAVLARPGSHGRVDIDDVEAARITDAYRVLLDLVGDGVSLTAAGYLPPSLVEQVAHRAGITDWWIGKANREDLTPPVAAIRDTARALGLVRVSKGRLFPTAAAVRCGQDPLALWRHIVSRLPLGTKPVERHAGWMALAVVGSDAPAEVWGGEISELLMIFGWRSGRDRVSPPAPHSTTLEVLALLAGEARKGWRLTGADPAVAATARASLRGAR